MIYAKYIMLKKKEDLRMMGKYASIHIIFMLAAKTNQTPNFRELTAMDFMLMFQSMAACGFPTWGNASLQTFSCLFDPPSL